MKLALMKQKAGDLDPEQEMTAAEAARFLEISGPKMSKLLGSGALHSRANLLDGRQRLIPCRDIIALLTLPTLAEAREALGVSARKMTQLLQSGALPYRKHPLNEHAYTVTWADVETLHASGGKAPAQHVHAQVMRGARA